MKREYLWRSKVILEYRAFFWEGLSSMGSKNPEGILKSLASRIREKLQERR